MPKLSQPWGDCIRALLQRHGLTYRGAMLKAGGSPSHTTIKDWCDGIIPYDYSKAYAFLGAFPVDEAVECLRAGEMPVPLEWGVQEEPEDLIRRYVKARRGDMDAASISITVRDMDGKVTSSLTGGGALVGGTAVIAKPGEFVLKISNVLSSWTVQVSPIESKNVARESAQ